MQEDWYQLWAEVPYFGRQWVGWLWTTQIKAGALSVGMQGCSGGAVTILDRNGQPVDGGLGGLGSYLPGLGL